MLEFGGLLIGASILIVAFLVPQFRRPDPPRWTKSSMVGELMSVGIVTVLSLGVAFFVAGVLDVVQHGVSLVHLALLILVVGGVIFFGRWINARSLSKQPAR